MKKIWLALALMVGLFKLMAGSDRKRHNDRGTGPREEVALTKKCAKCGEIKPHSEFYRGTTSRDRLHCYCKECMKAYDRQRYEAKKNARTKVKACSRCGKSKPLSEFYKNARSNDGLQAYCKECSKVTSLRWYDQNKKAVNG